MDTADHTAQELSSLIRLHCGSLSFSVDVYERSAERYCAKLTARVSALESSMGKALGLLSEVLTGSRLNSEREITDILRQRRTAMQQQLVNNGHASAMGRAAPSSRRAPPQTSGPTATTATAGSSGRQPGTDFTALSETLTALAGGSSAAAG